MKLRRERAAILIQSTHRGRIRRMELLNMFASQKDRAVRRIQAVWRVKTRRERQERERLRLKMRRRRGLLRIQRRIRRWLRVKREKRYGMEWNSDVVLERVWYVLLERCYVEAREYLSISYTYMLCLTHSTHSAHFTTTTTGEDSGQEKK